MGDALGDHERLARFEADGLGPGEEREAPLDDVNDLVGGVRVERRHEAGRHGVLHGDDAPGTGHRRQLEQGVGSHARSFAHARVRSQAASLRLAVRLTELGAGQLGEELAEGLDLVVGQRPLEEGRDRRLVVSRSRREDP